MNCMVKAAAILCLSAPSICPCASRNHGGQSKRPRDLRREQRQAMPPYSCERCASKAALCSNGEDLSLSMLLISVSNERISSSSSSSSSSPFESTTRLSVRAKALALSASASLPASNERSNSITAWCAVVDDFCRICTKHGCAKRSGGRKQRSMLQRTPGAMVHTIRHRVRVLGCHKYRRLRIPQRS